MRTSEDRPAATDRPRPDRTRIPSDRPRIPSDRPRTSSDRPRTVTNRPRPTAGASPAAERLRRLQIDDRRRGGLMHRGGAAALALAPAVPQPAPEPPRPRHLRVVEPGTLSPAQRRRRARAVLMGAIGAASFIAFALVYLHVVLAQRQFGIDRLDTKVQQEQAAYQNLRLKVAQLGSPAQIISTAVGQLGMVQPTGVTYLAPPAGGSPSTPAATTPSTVAPLGTPPAASAAGVPAPAGDANWPTIKSQLAGLP